MVTFDRIRSSCLLVAIAVNDDEHNITATINFVLSVLFSPQAVDDDERSVFNRITAQQTTIVDNDDDDE